MLGFVPETPRLGSVLENGFVVYNDEKDMFEKLKVVDVDPPLVPTGYPFRAKQADGTEYIYFTAPYPALRVKAEWKSYLDLSSYEGYTCLKPRHTLRRQGQGPARPRRRRQARVGVEEGHAAPERQGPGGLGRRRQDGTRGIAVPSAGRRGRQAGSC